MNVRRVLGVFAALASVTASVVGFIDAFAAHPELAYPWAVPVAVALISAAVGLTWVADHFWPPS